MKPAISGHPRKFFHLRPLISVGLAIIGLSLLFMLVPALDQQTSYFFYRDGVGFPAEQMLLPRLLRSAGLAATNIMLGLLVIAVIARTLLAGRFGFILPRYLVFLWVTIALGPGLLVNLVLKDHWGRARPVQTDLFGGTHPFSLPWVISDGCLRNCSFVSGEASSSFWFFAFAFIVPVGLRWPAAGLALVWTSAISLNRIAFGGHYLSDVVLAWGLTLFVLLLAREVILVRWGDRIDRLFMRRDR